MCGRYTLSISPRVLDKQFLLKDTEPPEASYNIAPSQMVLSLRESQKEGGRRAIQVRWGLIPFWAKDEKIGYKMINARSETAREKSAFRHAAKKRRCILPASGFYEWKREGKQKQPFYIYPGKPAFEGECLAFAGLWEQWKAPQGEIVESVSILTTAANEFMANIHDRMPVLLTPDAYDTWLDTGTELSEAAYAELVQPAPNDFLQAHPVGPEVNSPRNNHPALLEQVEAPEPFRPRPSEGPEDAEQGTLF
jgi:putative SOS response-associated peptidase YedK